MIKTGKQAEIYVAEQLSKNKYWVGGFEKTISGTQPFDQIAINSQHALCYDVKHCKEDYFHFSRIEENQKRALGYLNELKNPQVLTGFMLVYENEVYWLSYDIYLELESEDKKSVTPSVLGGLLW